jgi:hypothetical protein
VLVDRLVRQERLAELVVGACAQVEEAAQESSRSIGLCEERDLTGMRLRG